MCCEAIDGVPPQVVKPMQPSAYQLETVETVTSNDAGKRRSANF